MKYIYSIMIFLVSLFGLSACVASNSTYQNGSSNNSYQQKPTTSHGFKAEKWFLTKINNAPYDGKRITLNISADKKVSGFSGCNQYFVSSVKLNGNQLNFGVIGSTKRFCVNPDSNNLERRYLTTLGRVTRFQRSNSRLILEGSAGNLEFYKKSRR